MRLPLWIKSNDDDQDVIAMNIDDDQTAAAPTADQFWNGEDKEPRFVVGLSDYAIGADYGFIGMTITFIIIVTLAIIIVCLLRKSRPLLSNYEGVIRHNNGIRYYCITHTNLQYRSYFYNPKFVSKEECWKCKREAIINQRPPSYEQAVIGDNPPPTFEEAVTKIKAESGQVDIHDNFNNTEEK